MSKQQPATEEIRESVLELAKLSNLLFNTPEAVNAKVALIKEEIEKGRYTAHSSQIAHKLLELATPIPVAEEEIA